MPDKPRLDVADPESFMISGLADKRITFNMTPREAYDFAYKMATDDDFRTELKANPIEVLGRYHIHLPVQELREPIDLVPKEVCARALKDITLGRELKVSMIPDAVPFKVIFFFFIVWAAAPARRPSEGSQSCDQQ